MLGVRIGCQHHNFATTRTSNGGGKIAKKAKQKRGSKKLLLLQMSLHTWMGRTLITKFYRFI